MLVVRNIANPIPCSNRKKTMLVDEYVRLYRKGAKDRATTETVRASSSCGSG
jgi:hypothetical protein